MPILSEESADSWWLISQNMKDWTRPDFSRKTTINISKNADLLSNIYLFVKLPSIPPCNHSYLPNGIKFVGFIDVLIYDICVIEDKKMRIWKIDGFCSPRPSSGYQVDVLLNALST